MMNNEWLVRVLKAATIRDLAPNMIQAWGAAGKITKYRYPANNCRLYKQKELEDQ